jgi:hypothetical protein
MTTPDTTNDRLTRIETKLDLTLARLDNGHTDHEARLRVLERGRWPIPSLAVLVSASALAATLFGWGP